jgi:formylglycine-generating enzyme required for sulfatase activity
MKKKIILLIVLLAGASLLTRRLFFFHPYQPTVRVTPSGQPTKLVQSNPENCPDGFILVPGNPLYGTQDFCVMKYDAKCADTSVPNAGIEPSVNSQCYGQIGTYKNSGAGCQCTGSREVVSVPSGFPVTYIPMSATNGVSARDYCRSRGWRLITNNEWMTIARDTEKVPANWCNRDGTDCGHAPGTNGKILANGHNDNNPGRALTAAGDDQPCFGTTTDGSDRCGGKSSQKRTLTLTNGPTIWDFAGNVWQWVDATIARKDEPQSKTNGFLDQGWLWSEFAPGANASVITGNGFAPSLGYDAFRPSNPNWNSVNGVGRIYHYSAVADTDPTEYAFIRAGNWRHGYDSGAFTVHLSPVPDKTEIDDVGFRCTANPL